MSATSILLFLVALFILFNAGNFVGILQGNTRFSFAGGAKPTTTTATPTRQTTSRPGNLAQ